MSQAIELTPPGQRRRSKPSQTWVWGAMLVLLVTIVYLPTLDNGFASDDDYYIENNPELESLQGLSNIWFKLDTFEQYYPLVLSTFWVEYQLWGLNPRGYHAVNFLVHAAAAVLAWRLLVRLAVPGAWLAAAIFAVHPVEVESVAMTHELKNMLSGVFALGSLLAYLWFSPPEVSSVPDERAPAARGSWWYYALAFALYVAALLSKTAACSVPAVLLVIFWWKRGRLSWRDVAPTLPFFAVGLAAGSITIWMEKSLGAVGQDWALSPVERVLVAGRALWFYIGKLLWPHTLMYIYPGWVIDPRAGWQYLFPAAALSVIVGLWLAQKRIGRGPLAAVLIFAGVLVPGLGFFDLFIFHLTFVADHIQYHASIAMIALAIAAGVLVARRLPSQLRWLGPLAGAGLLVPLAALAQHQTHAWKNDTSVWENVAAQDPQSAVAHYALGFVSQGLGKYDEALSHFRQALEIGEQQVRDHPTAGKYRDEVAGCYVDIGLVQRQMGRPAEAESSFRQAIEIREKLVRDSPAISNYRSGLAWCYTDLAFAQRDRGLSAEAAASHATALEIREKLARDNPTNPHYKNSSAASYADLGLLERDSGRAAEAEASFAKAIEIRKQLIRDNPQVADYQASLAASYEDLANAQQIGGRLTDAEASRHKAIDVRQTMAPGTFTISEYQPEGRFHESLGTLRAQARLREDKYQDDFAASYVDLGLLERQLGRLAEAESSFRRAIEIRETLVRKRPERSDYRSGLAWCYQHLAAVQDALGRPADAEVSRRRAIAIREKLAD